MGPFGVWRVALDMRAIYSLLLLVPVMVLLPPASAQLVPARFDPLRFFEGRTEGEGTAKVIFKSPYGVRVHGRGRIARDGALVLDQTVEEDGKPSRIRSWHIREIAPGRYAGTLSDAIGPVRLEIVGGRFHIKFKMKGGLGVEQWLSAAPGGGSVHNSMMIRKFGLKVATLEESIRRIGGALSS